MRCVFPSTSRMIFLFCLTALFGTSRQTLVLAAEVCISEAAQKTLTSCPNGGPTEFRSPKGKTPELKVRGVAPALDPKKKEQMTKPGMPSFEQAAASRDERMNRLQARAKALLVTELQGLEGLFKATSATANDRAQIMRRLAEDYVELETSATREKVQAEIDRDLKKKSDQVAAGQKQAAANAADTIAKRARQNAIRYYTQIKDDYPQQPALDEVLYYLAYEYEQGGDYASARKIYFELIQKRPNSKYVPNAYLAFGELFFNEAQGDPSKWSFAKEAYEKVVSYPPEKTKVYGYAWYKLGYVHWNMGNFSSALNAFKKTIDYGVVYTDMPNAAKLAESARRDIIPVYALSGKPEQAYNFFRTVSGDAQGQNAKTLAMMDDLGINYIDTGHYQDAIFLYRELMGRDKSGAKTCLYQVHISEATSALKSGNKDSILAELENQLKVHKEFLAGSQSEELKHECSSKTAALVTETAMAWHFEAVGADGHGTKDPKAMKLSARLYKDVVDTWTQEEFKTFEFPRLVKEDWPSIFKIKYAMADLLYFQGDWEKCGPAFDSVVAENPNGPEAAEAAYASVLCFQNIYEKNHPKEVARKGTGNLPGQKTKDSKSEEDLSVRLKPKDLTESQKGMLQAFNRYTCYILPSATDPKGVEQLVEVKYARARTYFEAQHWEEAAAAFRDIAINYPDKESGIYAAQLYLESINILSAYGTPPRSSCVSENMTADVPKFVELYCQGSNLTKNPEQCTNLNKVQADLQRLVIERKLKEAQSATGTASLRLFEDAAVGYSDEFKKSCHDPVASGQPPQAEKCDEIAYNAAKAYQAARLLGKSIAARNALIKYDADTKMNSPLAKKALREIGGNYQAMAVYDKAAEYFERYVAVEPRGENADKALSDAVILRIGLGQEKEAVEDANLFRKNYGSSKPAQTAAVSFAVGSNYAEKGDWGNAVKSLSSSMGVIEKAGLDIQIQARATLAHAYQNTKRGKTQAKSEYAKVRALWGDGTAALSKIKSAYPDEGDTPIARRLARALNAVGEAYFYAAEEMKAELVDSVKFPSYSGPGDRTTVLKHVSTKVKDWLEKKRPLIAKTEAEYKKIIDLKPDAPPKWVIAAGSRVGLMWGNFVDEFRAAPIPVSWKNNVELRGLYYDALDASSQPIKDGKAKPALKTCLDYSVKFQYFDDYSRSCELWLGKNYKSEYHVVDEIRGAPTLANSALDDQIPPVYIGGQFWRAPSSNANSNKNPSQRMDEKDTKNQKVKNL